MPFSRIIPALPGPLGLFMLAWPFMLYEVSEIWPELGRSDLHRHIPHSISYLYLLTIFPCMLVRCIFTYICDRNTAPFSNVAPITFALRRIFHSSRAHQYLRRFKTQTAALEDNRSKVDLSLSSPSGLNRDRLTLLKDHLISELAYECDVFVPVFTEFVAKREIWSRVVEPRVLHFRGEVEHLLRCNDEVRVSKNGEQRPTLDRAIVGVLSELHAINGAIFQLAVTMVGEQAIVDGDVALHLFDLDDLVEPYLRTWLDGVQREFDLVVMRCLREDRGDVQNESLK